MKTRILALALVSALQTAISTSSAQTVVFSNNFGTGFIDGNLVGQKGWTQTSTAINNPYQVTNSQVVILTTGQDAWSAFSTFVTNADSVGGYLQTRINLRLDSAQAAGDYFFHVSSPTNTTGNFYQRLYARSISTGFQFGLSVSSTNAINPAVWGSSILSFSTNYSAVLRWDFLSGASNDTIRLFIDPVGDPGMNTAYASVTWGSLEPTTIQAVNFRQGTTANAPVVRVDSLDLVVVPEPSTLALLALALAVVAGDAARRRLS